MEKIVQTLSLFLILTVLYLGFTSCEPEEKSPLVGEWSFSNNTNRYYKPHRELLQQAPSPADLAC